MKYLPASEAFSRLPPIRSDALFMEEKKDVEKKKRRKKMRKHYRLTLKELAERLGLKHQISEIEYLPRFRVIKIYFEDGGPEDEETPDGMESAQVELE